MKWSILWLLGVFLAVGCTNEENELPVSDLDKDWFVITDNPDDPVDHERFLIYDTYGISIYYNDTIGSMIRQDYWGNDYIYYEVLQVFYSPGGDKPDGNFSLLEDKNVLLSQLIYLREKILSRVPRDYPFPPMLFVEDLMTSWAPEADVFRGFNALVVENVIGFDTLPEEDKRELDTRVLGGILSSLLFTREEDWLQKNFYPCSKNLNPDPYTSVYSSGGSYGGVTVGDACYGTDLEISLNALGFLRPLEESDLPEEYWYTPTQIWDVITYAELLFRYTMEEIEQLYASYPVVLEKYRMIRAKAETFGFILD